MKQFAIDDGPCVHENDFDIEEDEEHGHEVKLDRKAGVGRADGVLAAFIGLVLGCGPAAPLADDYGRNERENGKADCQHNLQKDRDVILWNLRHDGTVATFAASASPAEGE